MPSMRTTRGMVDIFLFEFPQDRVARKVGSGGTAKRRGKPRAATEPDNRDGGIGHVAAACDRERAGAVLGVGFGIASIRKM